MFDDYDCVRCKQGFKWEQMTATRSGALFCPDCWQDVNPENEPKRNCPVDGAIMNKLLMGDSELFIVNLCPSSHGAWFDKVGLDYLRQRIRDQDRDEELTALSFFLV